MDKCEACGEGAVLTETKWMCDDCGHWNREYEEIEDETGLTSCLEGEG